MKDDITFRAAYGILLIHGLAFYTILVLITDGLNVDVKAYFFSAILPAIGTFAMIRYFKIIVTKEGVSSYDFWGRSRFVEWNNITQINPVRIIGLKYIRVVYSTGKQPLWMPLFLDDVILFKKEVKKRVESSNPLIEYLERHV
ncbi:MAG: hypothetical protein L3J70_08005 [Gammaproteobacteria bacterium]|nr:hypothetical protein [Gammaproteobacteria bacterium]